MKIVLQRVKKSELKINDKKYCSIGEGLLLLVGFTHDDSENNALYLAEKSVNLRIFNDANGKMSKSALDKNLEILAVSQFTLYGDTKKGRRPGFDQAMKPEMAKKIYNYFIKCLEDSGLKIQSGVFGADMQIELENDGPVTFILEN